MISFIYAIYGMLIVLQPNADIFHNLARAYADDFLILYDNMGHKDHKNQWAHLGALEHFLVSRPNLTPLSHRAPKTG